MHDRTDLKIIGTLFALAGLGVAAEDSPLWVCVLCVVVFAVFWGLALFAPDSWFGP